TAIGGAGDADPARLRDAGLDQGFGAGADIDLFRPAPAFLLHGLLEFQGEAGGAAIVRLQHGETGTGVILRIDGEGILIMARRPAMDVENRADRLADRAIEPALDRQAIIGFP